MNTISIILNALNYLHSHIPNPDKAKAHIPKRILRNLIMRKSDGDPGSSLLLIYLYYKEYLIDLQ